MGSFETTRRTFFKAASSAAILARTLRAQRGGGAQQGAAPAGSGAPPKTARITSSVMLGTIPGSFEEAIAKAARVGMQSVELVSQQAVWSDAEMAQHRALAESYGIGIDALLSQTDWVNRPVSMVNPAHREAFLRDVQQAIIWSKKLNVPQIIVLSGNEQPGMTHEAQYASLVESGKRAAALAEQADVKLILENLNSKVNHKGYFLTSAREALQAVKDVDSPHFRLLFDIYHEYVQNGDPIPVIKDAAPFTAVFHVADAPGRHDPGTGEMKWDEIYAAIARTGYAGYIAMEYQPQGDPVQSLMRAVTQMRKDVNGDTAKAG